MKVVFAYGGHDYFSEWDAAMSCVPRIGDSLLWDHEDESKVTDYIVENVIWVFDPDVCEPYAHVSLGKVKQ